MRTYILFLMCILSLSLFAQEKEKTKKDSIETGWKSKGMLELLFNQSAFNDEWQGGGTSNVAGNFNLNQDLNYKTKKISWDTKLLTNIGLAIARDQEFVRKTTDRFEINSIFGSKASITQNVQKRKFSFPAQH